MTHNSRNNLILLTTFLENHEMLKFSSGKGVMNFGKKKKGSRNHSGLVTVYSNGTLEEKNIGNALLHINNLLIVAKEVPNPERIAALR